MANNRDRRVSNLENETGGGLDEIRVRVNWRNDGLILDDDTGEFVTRDDWKRRHPNDRLIIVGWEDLSDDDQEQELVPA